MRGRERERKTTRCKIGGQRKQQGCGEGETVIEDDVEGSYATDPVIPLFFF